MPKDPVLMSFGERVAALRRERRLSQEDMAARAGIGTQFLSKVERGITNPSLLTILGLARALDLPATRLIAEPGQVEAEIAAVLQGQPDRDRLRVLAVVRAMMSA